MLSASQTAREKDAPLTYKSQEDSHLRFSGGKYCQKKTYNNGLPQDIYEHEKWERYNTTKKKEPAFKKR
jgi:hypothetical protein